MKNFKCFLNIIIGFLLISFFSEKVISLPLTQQNNVEELGNHYQGDIVRPPPSLTDRGVAVRPKALYRWQNGVVPYAFAANISTNNAAYIVQMMREIELLTAVNGTQCVSFRPRVANDSMFITIFNGTGCYAPVGNWAGWRGLRPVSLMNSAYGSCIYSGIIQHELTHVLGLYHEQSRPDRDDYITINWDNIDEEQKFNFDKYTNNEVDTQMTPYDYGSLMHYDRYAFAINRSQPTIVPTRNSSAFIGQRVGLSPIDIIEIQRYYDCIPTPTATISTTSSTSTRASNSNLDLQTSGMKNKSSYTVLCFSLSFDIFLLLFLWNY